MHGTGKQFHSVVCLLIVFTEHLAEEKFLMLMTLNASIFKSMHHALGSGLRTLCLALDSKAAFYVFFLNSFVVLPFVFKSVIFLELVFRPGVRFQLSVSFGFQFGQWMSRSFGIIY